MSEEWRDELVTKGAVVDALKDNMFRLTLAEEQRCEGHVVWDEDVVFADVLEKALLALQPAQPKKVKWIKKMKVTETDKYTSYDSEWYCPKCGTKYDPIFAQRVKFCCVCGADIMGEQG